MNFLNSLEFGPIMKRFAIATMVAMVLSTIVPGISVAAPLPGNKVGINLYGFVLSGDYSEPGGQPTGIGEIKNGNVGAYPEGACVPIEIEVKNNHNVTGDTIISPVYDYFNTTVGVDHLEKITTGLSGNPRTSADNLNDFAYPETDLTTVTSFNSSSGAISAVVTGPFEGSDSSTDPIGPSDASRHYNISLVNIPVDAIVYVILCARIGVDASLYNGGAALSLRTAQGGNENVPIPVNQLLELPSVTINKTVVGGGPSSADDFEFNLSPDVNGHVGTYSTTGGTITIENVSPDGNFTITENAMSGYTFQSGTGTNCTFNGSTATAAVLAGKPAVNAICSFTNAYTAPGTLTVFKQMVNDNGGTNVPEDYTIDVTGGNATPGSFSGSADGTVVTLDAGSNYDVTEGAHVGYDVSYSADCSGTIAAGESKTCTITNDDIQPALTVVKIVDGGDLGIGDFTLFVDLFQVISGQSNNFDAGTYTVSETTNQDYTGSFTGDCDANGSVTLSPGDDATCTLTNAYQTPPPASLTVIKTVINDDIGDNVAGDFTINVSGTNVSDEQFPGDANGTTVTLDAGDYSVTESEPAGYNVSYSEECSGTVTPGQEVVCTVTNNDFMTSSIFGTKFNDLDNNGAWNNEEPPLAGWTIYVDLNLNGVLDSGEPSDVTDLVGGYSFSGLLPGPYVVREVGQSGWTQTFPNSDSSNQHAVNLGSTDALSIDFGNHENPIPQTGGFITGIKFNDIDGNGTQGDGEEGLEGWVIFADLNDNGVLDEGEPSGETNSDGRYNLHILDNGTFEIKEVTQTGWTQVFPTADGSHLVEVSAGMALDFNYNFGNQVTVTTCDDLSINGFVFNDLNSSTEHDPGEPALVGWVLYIDTNNNNTHDSEEPFTESDATGNFSFSGLSNDIYTIREITQSGWSLIIPSSGNGGEYLVTLECPSEQFEISDFLIQAVASNGTDLNFANVQQPTPPSGGGGGGGGNPIPPTTPTPPGQVADDQIAANPPAGEVLGDQLPVTGSSTGLAMILLLGGYLAYTLLGRRQVVKN